MTELSEVLNNASPISAAIFLPEFLAKLVKKTVMFALESSQAE
jgi:hypothetical protein